MSQSQKVSKLLIPDAQRLQMVERLFGICYVLKLEPLIFRFAETLTSNYDGGYWAFYTLSNDGFYMAPTEEETYAVRSDNGFAGCVSADTLGLIACLYAYSEISFGKEPIAESCGTHYHLLREFVLDHTDAALILAAID